jgi:hypothetical protein
MPSLCAFWMVELSIMRLRSSVASPLTNEQSIVNSWARRSRW